MQYGGGYKGGYVPGNVKAPAPQLNGAAPSVEKPKKPVPVKEKKRKVSKVLVIVRTGGGNGHKRYLAWDEMVKYAPDARRLPANKSWLSLFWLYCLPIIVASPSAVLYTVAPLGTSIMVTVSLALLGIPFGIFLERRTRPEQYFLIDSVRLQDGERQITPVIHSKNKPPVAPDQAPTLNDDAPPVQVQSAEASYEISRMTPLRGLLRGTQSKTQKVAVASLAVIAGCMAIVTFFTFTTQGG